MWCFVWRFIMRLFHRPLLRHWLLWPLLGCLLRPLLWHWLLRALLRCLLWPLLRCRLLRALLLLWCRPLLWRCLLRPVVIVELVVVRGLLLGILLWPVCRLCIVHSGPVVIGLRRGIVWPCVVSGVSRPVLYLLPEGGLL